MSISEEKIQENKKQFIDILTKIDRPGITETIAELEKLGFFEAPASVRNHGCYPGGLVEHSLNVYKQAIYLFKIEQKIRPDVMKDINMDSIAIAALLHDVCKADAYANVEKWRKDVNSKWERYLSYERVYPSDEFGHGEASVIRLMRFGLDLHSDEALAIRWHMGAWDISQYPDAKNCFNEASRKYPLVPIIVTADWLASRISEAEEPNSVAAKTE